MRRIALIVFAGLVLATAGGAVFFRTARTPQYNGRSADYWLDALYSRTTTNTQSEAFEAFRTMGNAALPFLLQNLEAPETAKAKFHTYVYDHCPALMRKRIAKPVYIIHRSAAELVLMNIGSISNAMPALVKLAEYGSGTTRQLAMTVLLNRVHNEHPEYASAFLPSLTDSNGAVRYLAVQLLTDIENRSSNVVAQVANLLNDPDDMVRTTAAYGVWKLSGETNRPVVVLTEELGKANIKTFSPYFKNAGADYRRLVIHHLFDIDPRSPVVADFFRKRLKSPEAEMRRQACLELQRLGRSARFLTDDVSPLLSDPDNSVKDAARNAWMAIKPRRSEAAPL